MSTTELIILVVVVLAVFFLGGLWAARRRRRSALKDRFGPEYDRTLRSAGSEKTAEAELQRRVEARSTLDIRPLSANERDIYQQEWRQIQADFVDLPQASLGRADALIERMMNACGYPTREFDQKADLISVDHPAVVEDYRRAHGVFLVNALKPVSVEEARRSLLAYRSLYSELTGGDTTEPEQNDQSAAPKPTDRGENRV